MRRFKLVFPKKMAVLTFFISLMLFFFLLTPTVHAATRTLNSFDLVDSGKHLDWNGRTNYMPQFEKAIETWNNHKPGVIRKDTAWTIEDVRIADYYSENNIVASCSSGGKIRFNQYNMDRNSDAQNQNACASVLGIALGLGKTSNPKDIMYSSINTITSLSDNDKESYNAAYKKY